VITHRTLIRKVKFEVYGDLIGACREGFTDVAFRILRREKKKERERRRVDVNAYASGALPMVSRNGHVDIVRRRETR